MQHLCITQIFVFFLCFSLTTTTRTCLGCIESERQALVKFKESLTDSYHRLSSWNNATDCCKWHGVGCDPTAGHVVNLHLPLANLEAPLLSSALLDLKFLNHLDLSGSNFQYSPLPDFIASFHHLRYLNLSNAFFSGLLPRHLPITLQVLDLSHNTFNSSVPLFLGISLVHLNLASNRFDGIAGGGLSAILSNLCQLKSIDLTSNSIHGQILQLHGTAGSCVAYDLEILRISFNKFSGKLPPALLGQLKNLKFLTLNDNLLTGPIPASVGELSALIELDLSYNQLTGTIPASLGKLSSLRILDMDTNNLTGSIPEAIGGLSGLIELDLSFNKLKGGIPASIGRLTSLRKLNLGFNRLSGTIPVSLGLLSKLESLEIYFNSLQGLVSEAHFANTSMLKYIDARSNSMLMFKMKSDWIPPFQLTSLLAGSCKVGPQFPSWLQMQKELVNVNLSSAGISGALPSWLRTAPITALLVASNQITGPLSNLPSKIEYVDLSRNNITGHLISTFPSTIRYLYLSHNHLSGMIPQSITALSSLIGLNLSYNNLSGRIPTGNHIQVLSDPSVYAGNPLLCGAPLSKKCP